jgi:HPt (histidine-containing phosphotransfer) domain-containing protein
VQNRTFTNQRLIRAANYFFGTAFSKVDDLVAHFEKVKFAIAEEQVQIVRAGCGHRVARKITKLQERCQRLEDENIVLKREKSVLTFEQATQLGSLKRDFDQRRSDFELTDSDQRHQIQRLEQTVQVLTKKLAKENSARQILAVGPIRQIRRPNEAECKLSLHLKRSSTN